jgi:hypothetical protein
MCIACSYVNGSTLDVGMIGHYTFEGNANDIGSSGNNLQLNGSYEYISTGHNGGQALRMNGDRSLFYNGGGYMRASFMENIGFSAVTFNFWTRGENMDGSLDPTDKFVTIGNGDDSRPTLSIQTDHPGQTFNYKLITRDSNNTPIGFSSPAYNAADWKMLTLTVTGAEYAAYVNGVEFVRGAPVVDLFPTPLVAFAHHTWWGGSASASRMTLEYDDMRIYDKALNSSEVSNLYAAESVPEPSALSLLAVGLGGWAMTRRRRS